MRRLLVTAIVFGVVAHATAANPIPPDLVGIWATDGSQFRNEAILGGQAIYLDTDGVGAVVGGDGGSVIAVRMIVTSYNPDTQQLKFDLTESGKVVTSGALAYESAQRVLVSAVDPGQRYLRWANSIPPEIRRSLGLEARAN